LCSEPGRRAGSGALLGVAALLLGVLVAVLGVFAMMMWSDAHDPKKAAKRAAASVSGSMAVGNVKGTMSH